MRKSILVLNGPNLNMLGVREPCVYGYATLKDVEDLCHRTATDLGFDVVCRQSNAEDELIAWIQNSKDEYAGVVINAAAFSHTSIAIRDALTLIPIPIVEVHITNIHAREEFRHHSYISAIAKAVICGCGIDGYAYAIRSLIGLINGQAPEPEK